MMVSDTSLSVLRLACQDGMLRRDDIGFPNTGGRPDFLLK